MTTTTMRALAIVLLATAATTAFAGEAADADLAILRESIQANRKALVAVNLGLTDAEAAKFWPIYDRYQGELATVNDQLVQVIQDYTAHFADLSDATAKTLVDRYLAQEEDRAKIRRAFLPQFEAVLSGRKVMRFYQIENKMDAVVRFDLAAQIPVVEE